LQNSFTLQQLEDLLNLQEAEMKGYDILRQLPDAPPEIPADVEQFSKTYSFIITKKEQAEEIDKVLLSIKSNKFSDKFLTLVRFYEEHAVDAGTA